ncbi:MAG: hypothetical protein JWN60_1504, partial [Acidobacteria bacterium]|nr:hypothetical protein [Acidobacteriota bacterium]
MYYEHNNLFYFVSQFLGFVFSRMLYYFVFNSFYLFICADFRLFSFLFLIRFANDRQAFAAAPRDAKILTYRAKKDRFQRLTISILKIYSSTLYAFIFNIENSFRFTI